MEMRNLRDQIHGNYVHTRRVRALANKFAELIPPNARVLDVGCGDGFISHLIQVKRPDIVIEGIDVLVRDSTHIPVIGFDGQTLPFADNEFDVVLFVDVLHHTDDPNILLNEAYRVSKNELIIKDHTQDGLLAGPTLRFMDRVGNARHGVVIPYNYWPECNWRRTFSKMGLKISFWTQSLNLYPWWGNWLFGRSLHFIARVTK